MKPLFAHDAWPCKPRASIGTRMNRHIASARKSALEMLVRDARTTLPEGWSVVLAVGWGLTVYHGDKTVIGLYEDEVPARLPKGVRAYLKAVADFVDTFGYDNERITHKGLSSVARRRCAA